MKKIASLILGFVLLGMVAHAQIVKPVSWSFTSKKIQANVYEVRFMATIANDWNIYSQWTPEGGPERTIIRFSPNINLLLGGKVKEIGTKKIKFEDVFDVDVHYYEDKVDFVQIVKVKSMKGNMLIKGKINYMTCDKDQCISDEVDFSIPLK